MAVLVGTNELIVQIRQNYRKYKRITKFQIAHPSETKSHPSSAAAKVYSQKSSLLQHFFYISLSFSLYNFIHSVLRIPYDHLPGSFAGRIPVSEENASPRQDFVLVPHTVFVDAFPGDIERLLNSNSV